MRENESYKYDAFISYRHTEPDKSIAEKLHRMLESFKVPKSLTRRGIKKKVGRVFRDREELPTSSNLADSINEALANSEHLIVICSPRTSQSKWVMQEIETFSKLHGQDRILALLVEGEPDESFPEPLRLKRRQVVGEDGEVREVVEEVEPLAADIRADSLGKMKKKLKVEILRLLAPILNCRFDDLRQRHRERAIKRILSLSISLSVFFLGFGSFSAWQAWQIRQKSVLLEQQVQKTLEGQSLYMANISTQLLEEGDRRTAIMVAREALPADLDNPERPYVEEAEYALSQALHVYKTDNRFLPDVALKHDNIVNFICLGFDGETAVTWARDGYLYVWDTRHGDLLNKHYTGERYPRKGSLAYADDRTIVYMADGRLTCLDLETMKANWEYDEYITRFELSSDGRSVAVINSETVALLDMGTGAVLFRHDIEDYLKGDGFVYVTSMSMDDTARYLCLGTNSGRALLFDIKKNSLLREFRVEYDEITDVAVSDGIVAVASSDFVPEATDLLSKGKGALDIFDFDGYRRIERQFDYSSISGLAFSPYDKNLLVFTESEKINVLDVSVDKLLYTFISGDNVSDYIIWDGFVISSSYDGTIRFWVMDGIGWEYFLGRVELSQGINNIMISSGVVAASYSYSDKAVLLRNLQNEDILRLSGLGNTINRCDFSPDGSMILAYTFNTGEIVVWDWETGEQKGIIETGMTITYARFTDEGRKILAAGLGGVLSVYDAGTLELLARDTYDYSVEINHISPDGLLCMVKTMDGSRIVRTNDLSLVAETDNFVFRIAQFYDRNKRVILASPHSGTTVYSTETGKELFTFPEEDIRAIAVSGKGNIISAIYPDNSIRLLDSDSFEERLVINDFDIEAQDVLFDDNGRYLFVCMDDYSLRCYETSSGKLAAELKGMSQATSRVIFDENRDILITQGENAEAIIWRWENKKKLGYLDRLIGVSPDFKTLISSQVNELLLIPFYDTRMLIEKAEKQLEGRTLSDREKADLFILE
ncbi:MAG TPA: toll/interleukin-1 receptor domain-containing protein [Thermoclostridium sp.]|nr:toll/interleukin-1 receptor domain-containing protein [Thermoclostridium sp.]HPU45678.1 toll/interleukin-1 receptor domain-containing protein [Thermoclostridium sp.]